MIRGIRVEGGFLDKGRMRGVGRVERVMKWRLEGNEYDQRDGRVRWIPR